MAAYELTGEVKKIFDLQTFDSGFSKREFVIMTEDERFPQPIKMSCLKNRTSLLDELAEGDRVQVTFDLRGNEYKERFYVDLVAWKIDKLDAAAAEPAPDDQELPPLPTQPPPAQEDDMDDLPF